MEARAIRYLSSDEFLVEMYSQDTHGKRGAPQESWKIVANFENNNPENMGSYKPFVLVGGVPIEPLVKEHEPEFPDLVTRYANLTTEAPPIYIKLSSYRLNKEGQRARPRVLNGNHRLEAAILRGDSYISSLMSLETWQNIKSLGLTKTRKNPDRLCSCPATSSHIDGIDPNVRKLLVSVVNRRNFGPWASPGGRPHYIQAAMMAGLVVRAGYYTRTGLLKFKLTVCGKRVAEYLLDRSKKANHDLREGSYITCPKPELDTTQLGYHDYEHWAENPSSISKKKKWNKIKEKTSLRIKPWIDDYLEKAQYISRRYLSQLVSRYAKTYKVPQEWAYDHLKECGIREILQ